MRTEECQKMMLSILAELFVGAPNSLQFQSCLHVYTNIFDSLSLLGDVCSRMKFSIRLKLSPTSPGCESSVSKRGLVPERAGGVDEMPSSSSSIVKLLMSARPLVLSSSGVCIATSSFSVDSIVASSSPET